VSGGNTMFLILLGVAGFGLLLAADFCGIRKYCKRQNLLAFFGTSLIVISSIIILYSGRTFDLAFALRLMFGLLGLVFLAILIYSVLIEVKSDTPVEKNLVTTGTYALSRHPGVLWLFCYYVFGSFFFGNIDILIAGVVWTFVNVIYVIVQENFVFNKIFKNYQQYKETTPMLLPNFKSIRRCINTLDGGKNEKLKRNA
jgi:protein-S-isoprenylcysteine O-methyltransferase Ste14